MAETLSIKTLKTRKPHDCFGCAREFSVGTIMLREGVKDGGSVFTAYLCESCQAVMSNFNFGDEFGFGELLDDALEYEAAQREEGQGKQNCHTCGHDCAGIEDGPCRDYAPSAAHDTTSGQSKTAPIKGRH